jgi:hypothetical protein
VDGIRKARQRDTGISWRSGTAVAPVDGAQRWDPLLMAVKFLLLTTGADRTLKVLAAQQVVTYILSGR